MKIAVTAQGIDLDARVDPRFGRARYFIIVDTDTDDFLAVDNSLNLNAAQGAGIQSGKNVIDQDVEAVLTGHVGPKAYATLNLAGIAVYPDAKGTVRDAVAQFTSGQLTEAEKPDVGGHWV